MIVECSVQGYMGTTDRMVPVGHGATVPLPYEPPGSVSRERSRI